MELTGETSQRRSDLVITLDNIWTSSQEKAVFGGLRPGKSSWSAQLQRLARVLKFWIKQVHVLDYLGSEQ